MTDYRNDTPMKDRLDALFNDRNVLRRKDTFASRADAEVSLENQGRFSKINKETVVGATPAPPDYAAPNWAPQAAGVEPPLGIDVNAIEPVGEPWEVEASLERLERAARQASTSLDALPARGAGAAPSNITASSVPANPIPTTATTTDVTTKRRRL